jgi:hypothetical protein
MAIGVYLQPRSMSAAQYDEAVRRLDAAGAGHPAGRLHHSCLGPDGQLTVFDVWESQQALDAYVPTVWPILQALGLDQGAAPIVVPIHNLVD